MECNTLLTKGEEQKQILLQAIAIITDRQFQLVKKQNCLSKLSVNYFSLGAYSECSFVSYVITNVLYVFDVFFKNR